MIVTSMPVSFWNCWISPVELGAHAHRLAVILELAAGVSLRLGGVRHGGGCALITFSPGASDTAAAVVAAAPGRLLAGRRALVSSRRTARRRENSAAVRHARRSCCRVGSIAGSLSELCSVGISTFPVAGRAIETRRSRAPRRASARGGIDQMRARGAGVRAASPWVKNPGKGRRSETGRSALLGTALLADRGQRAQHSRRRAARRTQRVEKARGAKEMRRAGTRRALAASEVRRDTSAGGETQHRGALAAR